MICDSRGMRIPACIWLCPEDRGRLERLVADRNTSRKVVWRSRIVLLSAGGHGTMEIMRRTGTSKPTVWRWQERYLEAGVDGLLRDKSRPPGTPPLDPAIKMLVLTKTMRETPPNATHWSVRSMARAVGISHTSVQKIWREHGLKPHRVNTFKVSNDPAFAEKVADVVGLYLDPQDKALVLSVDEKSQIQALDRTGPARSRRSTFPAKRGPCGDRSWRRGRPTISARGPRNSWRPSWWRRWPCASWRR